MFFFCDGGFPVAYRAVGIKEAIARNMADFKCMIETHNWFGLQIYVFSVEAASIGGVYLGNRIKFDAVALGLFDSDFAN